jgi:aminoglycoside phosphotransferase (APT) family kinase protein
VNASTSTLPTREISVTRHVRTVKRIPAGLNLVLAPEALAHRLLRERGVRAPQVLYVEDCHPALGRSVMVTTEIAGDHIGRRPVDGRTRQVMIEAGRQLALINGVPVDDFGWIRRDAGARDRLAGEHPTQRAFIEERLDDDLAALEGHALTGEQVAAIRAVVEAHPGWLDGERARLAHGDFDVTHIYERDGRYTGVIDFGEIRGAGPWYDLGHFRMHDGETLPALVLDWLIEGYRSVTPLPPDYRERISLASLLIAIRALARGLEKNPSDLGQHQGLVAIRRDLAVLRA